MRIPFVNIDRSIPNLLKRVNSPNLAAADPMTVINRALPESLPIKVTDMLPRVKEGGAFVKFSHDGTVSKGELETTLKKYLKEQPIKPWFNPLRRVRAFLVQGRPWIEDLYRVPSSRLKVEFLGSSPEAVAAELTQETLFSLFRRYGKIADIKAQPSDSKIVPKYAMVDFTRIRFAVMAKNCMHGFKILPEAGGGQSGTILKISFEQKAKTHWLRDWLFSHPRIVVPAVAALVAAVTVAIFDPIRTFFIKTHITQAFHLEGNIIGRWVRNQVNRANDIFRFGKRRQDDESLEVLFEDRQGAITQIKTWLIETADTFIVVQGPRGSGKREVVLDQALEDRKYKLVIDCKPIQEARGDSATIGAAAAEVGYKPVFSWLNSMSSLIDLAAQGTIGTKTGFSETLDTQLAKIWGNSATALKQIALSSRKKTDKDADLTDDEYLEAHPERRPVVIIDNFLHKANENSLVYDKIAEWAAALTTTNIAHVIFLTNDVSFSKSLSKALPDRVFRQIVLSDCSPETAKRFVMKQLEADAEDIAGQQPLTENQLKSDLDKLDETISILGGRLTDLEFLARRIKTGESPKSMTSDNDPDVHVLTTLQKRSKRSSSNLPQRS
jgi:RNA12 protein/RNA recognition motif. (a.k.a. RRM, RBD, or RNP domain)